jgi:hypothetical protein
MTSCHWGFQLYVSTYVYTCIYTKMSARFLYNLPYFMWSWSWIRQFFFSIRFIYARRRRAYYGIPLSVRPSTWPMTHQLCIDKITSYFYAARELIKAGYNSICKYSLLALQSYGTLFVKQCCHCSDVWRKPTTFLYNLRIDVFHFFNIR